MSDHVTPPTKPPRSQPADDSATLPPQDAVTRTRAEPGGAEAELAAGVVVEFPRMLGRYQLQKLLGKGGMGAVYLAQDTQLDRPVALKIPSFSGAGQVARDRFVQEARAAALVSHPNLCPVYDAGIIDGVEYLTMAYIEGKPLSAWVRGGKQLPERTAATLVFQLARAMQAAHERGIIHRDLKPDNIMITLKKQPVIMDFGLARRSAGPQDVRLTQSGTFLGTPAYMSPEQVDGNVQAMGPGCDIYSLGVILYQLLTGRLPFESSSGLGSLIAQIVVDPPPPPRRFRPDLSARLEAICLKTLSKKPEDRSLSMAELARELDGFLRAPAESAELPAPDPSTAVFAHMVQTAAPQSVPTVTRSGESPRRARWPWYVGGAVAVAGALVALMVLWPSAPKPGRVFIDLSNPEAAVEVRVDGRRVERQELGQPLSLSAGDHELTVQGKAFHTVARTVSLGPGQELHVPVALRASKSVVDRTPPDETERPSQPPVVSTNQNDTHPSVPPTPPKSAEAVKPVSPPPPPTVRGPLPVPPPAELDPVRKEIQQAYAKMYASPNRTAWVALAERLRGQAEALRDQPARRYVLWDEARQLAIRAAAAPLAIRLCDDLAGSFILDALVLKTSTLHAVDEALASAGPALMPDDRPSFTRHEIQQALQVLDAAVRAKRFEQGFDVLQLAHRAQKRAHDGFSLVPVTSKEITALKAAFTHLARDAANGPANLEVGQVLCLSFEHWQTGLPLLAQAADPLWQAVAQQELKHPSSADGYIAVGEAWKRVWEHEHRNPERRLVGQRVRAWYDLALSELPAQQRGSLAAKDRQMGGAPNLGLIKPFFDGVSSDPQSGLPIHQTEEKLPFSSGYARGSWFMSTPDGFWFGTDIVRYAAPFACQLIARVVDPPSAAFNLVFTHRDGKHGYTIRVDGAGAVRVLATDPRVKQDIPVSVIVPKGIRPRTGFRKLLMVARARQLDLYMDDVPLKQTPIRLPFDIGSGQVHIGVISGSGAGGTIEVQRLTLWPADAVPPLRSRP